VPPGIPFAPRNGDVELAMDGSDVTAIKTTRTAVRKDECIAPRAHGAIVTPPYFKMKVNIVVSVVGFGETD